MIDISKITDYLYVGSRITTKDADELKLQKFSLIISMIGQMAPEEIFTLPPFKTLWIKTYDIFFLPIPVRKLLIGVQSALPVINDKGKVLVFCMQGRRRSIAMASAILIALGHTVDEAARLLMSSRKVADPRKWYIRMQIKAFEIFWKKNETRLKKQWELARASAAEADAGTEKIKGPVQTAIPLNVTGSSRTAEFSAKKIKKVRVIINPVAGKGDSSLSVINTAMKEAGIAWEASITHSAGDAIQFAKDAVKEKVDCLAVFGGDGTIIEAISGMMGSDIPLAILPGGSANVVATEFSIPENLKDACGLMTQEPIKTKIMDVGQFDNHYFITSVGFGFEADMVKGADRRTKNKVGILAYFISGLKALKKTKKATYRLVIDGQEHTVRGLTCIISNTGNLGFSEISFDKHIDVSDGFLDVIVVQKANLSLLKLIAITLLARERPDNFELVEHWQGRDIRLSVTPKQTVQCDGEVLEKIPLHIKVVPAAIKVLVPKTTDVVIQ